MSERTTRVKAPLPVIDYNSSSESEGEFLTLSAGRAFMFSSINTTIGEYKCYRQELTQ